MRGSLDYTTPARQRRIVADVALDFLKGVTSGTVASVIRGRKEQQCALIIQKHTRRYLLRGLVRQLLWEKRSTCSLLIQSSVRRWLGKKELHRRRQARLRERQKRLAAALTRAWLACVYRRSVLAHAHRVAGEERARRAREVAAQADRLERVFREQERVRREQEAGRLRRVEEARRRRAAGVVQRAFRGHVRRRHRAARQRASLRSQAANTIKQFVRRRTVILRDIQRQSAAARVQSWARGWLLRRNVQQRRAHRQTVNRTTAEGAGCVVVLHVTRAQQLLIQRAGSSGPLVRATLRRLLELEEEDEDKGDSNKGDSKESSLSFAFEDTVLRLPVLDTNGASTSLLGVATVSRGGGSRRQNIPVALRLVDSPPTSAVLPVLLSPDAVITPDSSTPDSTAFLFTMPSSSSLLLSAVWPPVELVEVEFRGRRLLVPFITALPDVGTAGQEDSHPATAALEADTAAKEKDRALTAAALRLQRFWRRCSFDDVLQVPQSQPTLPDDMTASAEPLPALSMADCLARAQLRGGYSEGERRMRYEGGVVRAARERERAQVAARTRTSALRIQTRFRAHLARRRVRAALAVRTERALAALDDLMRHKVQVLFARPQSAAALRAGAHSSGGPGRHTAPVSGVSVSASASAERGDVAVAVGIVHTHSGDSSTRRGSRRHQRAIEATRVTLSQPPRQQQPQQQKWKSDDRDEYLQKEEEATAEYVFPISDNDDGAGSSVAWTRRMLEVVIRAPQAPAHCLFAATHEDEENGNNEGRPAYVQ